MIFKINLKIGNEYFFHIVMALDIKAVENNPLHTKIHYYILEVTILPHKNFKIFKKDLVYLLKHSKLLLQANQQVD
jgi:hypothetical protein